MIVSVGVTEGVLEVVCVELGVIDDVCDGVFDGVPPAVGVVEEVPV